jgi:hypothetical protein
MLRGKKCIIVLALTLALTSTFFITSPRAFALSTVQHSHYAVSPPQAHGHPVKPYTLSTCSASSNWNMYIAYNNWNNTYYFCGSGYLLIRIANVQEIYDNGGAPMYVSFYINSGDRGYCSISGIGAWWDFSAPALIEQVDYGSSYSPSHCG